MRTVSIFKNGKNQAIRFPKDMEFSDQQELEIVKEGETIILRPIRTSWLSLMGGKQADNDFLLERDDVIEDDGRVRL